MAHQTTNQKPEGERSMKILVEQIAKTAYEAVRALGVCDLPLLPWDVAGDDDKDEAVETVVFLLENPNLGAKENYSRECLEILKNNPDYDPIEWEDLGEAQQAFFKVFFSVVDSLRLSAVR